MTAERLTVASWNINSIRRRLDLLEQVVGELRPDVLCLQEIKVTNELFPYEAVRALGFPHVAVHGQKGYHGVAVLSKLPLEDATPGHWCDGGEARHLRCRVAGIDLHNFYVPAGGPLPDPVRNPRFAQKLRFLGEVTHWFHAAPLTPVPRLLLGDLNVAPLESDVWSHERLRRVVTHTPVEVAALAALRRSQDWIDAVRAFVPEEEPLFSWWSYRAPDWDDVDKGRRLDHAWVTPPLRRALRAGEIVRDVRGWQGASDHAPLLVTLDLAAL